MMRRLGIVLACLVFLVVASVDDFGPTPPEIVRPEDTPALAQLRAETRDLDREIAKAEERWRCLRHTAELRAAIGREE